MPQTFRSLTETKAALLLADDVSSTDELNIEIISKQDEVALVTWLPRGLSASVFVSEPLFQPVHPIFLNCVPELVSRDVAC